MSKYSNVTRDRNRSVTAAFSTRDMHAGNTIHQLTDRELLAGSTFSVGNPDGGKSRLSMDEIREQAYRPFSVETMMESLPLKITPVPKKAVPGWLSQSVYDQALVVGSIISNTNNLPGRFRRSADHKVVISGQDFSDFVTEIGITEEIGKDMQVKVTLFDRDLTLTAKAALREGKTLTMKLYDGSHWRDFGHFLILTSERNYDNASTISLDCRTQSYKLRKSEISYKWEGQYPHEVVTHIAESVNLIASIDVTDTPMKEFIASNEELSSVMNRLCSYTQFEWYVRGRTLFFKKIRGKASGIVLDYRPDTGLGEIISAHFKHEKDKKESKDSITIVPTADFNKGATDPNTVNKSGKGKTKIDPNQSPTHISPEDTALGQATTQPADDTQKSLEDDPLLQHVLGYNYLPGSNAKLKVSALDDPVKVTHAGVLKENNAENAGATQKRLQTIKYTYVAEVNTYGMADLAIRQIISLRGFGSQSDNGKWLVTRITHTYTSAGSWQISMSNKSNTKPPASASGDGSGSGSAGVVDPEVESEDAFEVVQGYLYSSNANSKLKKDLVSGTPLDQDVPLAGQ
jgi:phage protein D